MHADLQRLMAPEMLDNLRAEQLPRLRDLRVQLTQAEGDISFVRRVTQGRLDIVGHEVARRERRAAAGFSDDEPDPDDGPQMTSASGLLFDMPDILTDADRVKSTTAKSPADLEDVPHTMPSRMVQVLEPGDIALALIEDLDQVASPGDLARVENLEPGQLADLFDRLRTFEIDLSSSRRTLHDRIDRIQDEIARRYRDGEATVDSLLQG
ncbi:MAG: hypothetical protein OEW83_02910 [Acidimicrobiia bacterium]|nr:hypothetical protein [Acidimicrobiia bacterium]